MPTPPATPTAPLFADATRPMRHAIRDRWFVDETYVKVASRWRYLYRAVDQYGQVINLLLPKQRDTAAARRFVTRALARARVPRTAEAGQQTDHDRVPDRGLAALRGAGLSSWLGG
jgi:transposase, IS6 family